MLRNVEVYAFKMLTNVDISHDKKLTNANIYNRLAYPNGYKRGQKRTPTNQERTTKRQTPGIRSRLLDFPKVLRRYFRRTTPGDTQRATRRRHQSKEYKHPGQSRTHTQEQRESLQAEGKDILLMYGRAKRERPGNKLQEIDSRKGRAWQRLEQKA